MLFLRTIQSEKRLSPFPAGSTHGTVTACAEPHVEYKNTDNDWNITLDLQFRLEPIQDYLIKLCHLCVHYT